MKEIDERIQKILKKGRSAENLHLLGDLHLKKGDESTAIYYYFEAAEAAQKQKAIAIYKKILRLSPKEMRAIQSLITIYSKTGLVAEEIRHLLLLAEHHRSKGEVQEELRVYRKVRALDPEHEAVVRYFGRGKTDGEEVSPPENAVQEAWLAGPDSGISEEEREGGGETVPPANAPLGEPEPGDVVEGDLKTVPEDREPGGMEPEIEPSPEAAADVVQAKMEEIKPGAEPGGMEPEIEPSPEAAADVVQAKTEEIRPSGEPAGMRPEIEPSSEEPAEVVQPKTEEIRPGGDGGVPLHRREHLLITVIATIAIVVVGVIFFSHREGSRKSGSTPVRAITESIKTVDIIPVQGNVLSVEIVQLAGDILREAPELSVLTSAELKDNGFLLVTFKAMDGCIPEDLVNTSQGKLVIIGKDGKLHAPAEIGGLQDINRVVYKQGICGGGPGAVYARLYIAYRNRNPMEVRGLHMGSEKILFEKSGADAYTSVGKKPGKADKKR